MAVNYFWNIALAEAMYPSLSALEIGLRNSIHNALAAHYNSNLWFHHQDFLNNNILKREINRAIGHLGGPAAQPTPGRIIAELHFSYWTIILSGYYHRLGVTPVSWTVGR